MVLISNFDIVKSELSLIYNLGEFISLNVPLYSMDEIKNIVLEKYGDEINTNTPVRSNINYALNNYKFNFANLNEYIYGFGELVKDNTYRTDISTDKQITQKITSHIGQYLCHVRNIGDSIRNAGNKSEIHHSLSRCQKLVLLAGFIASELPSKYDSKIFKNTKRTNMRTNKMRGHRSGKLKRKNENFFTLNRLLAIYSSMHVVLLGKYVECVDIEMIADVFSIYLYRLIL